MDKSSTVVIVGAGCSSGLVDLPTDLNFLDRYISEIWERPFLFEALQQLYPHESWQNERLEIVWTEIDENFNSPKIILNTQKSEEWSKKFYELADQESGSDCFYYRYYRDNPVQGWTPAHYLFCFAGWELRQIIYKKFNINFKKISSIQEQLVDRIIKEADGLPLACISFNYDTLIEQALDIRNVGWRYVSEQPQFFINNRDDYGQYKIPILKPHGSINWIEKLRSGRKAPHEDQLITSKETELIPSAPIGFSKKETGAIYLNQCSIVGLQLHKMQHTLQEENHVIRNTYQRIMDQMRDAIKDAKKLIILGYSFPMGDVHVINAFKSAIRESPHPRNIVIINKGEKPSLLTRDRIQNMLGPSVSVNCIYDKGIMEWIKGG